MTAKIQVRRDTTANWNAGTPPTLDVGEIGLDTDLKQIKIGDNTNNWTALPWLTGTLPVFSSPSTDLNNATNSVQGVFRFSSGAALTNAPAAPIDIKAADGGVSMLVLKFGTTVVQSMWTDGDTTVTPKSYSRVYDGDVSTWRDWVPQNTWGISATEGVNLVAKSITLKDTATGLTVDGNSTLTGDVTVNGTTTLGNANADIVTVQAGLVTAPIITTSGDTNTGIYFPGADQFGIATNGTAAITINNTQVVTLANAIVPGTLNVSGSVSANLSMGSNRITSLANPTAAQDAVTKNYLETNRVGQTAIVTFTSAGVPTSELIGTAYDGSAPFSVFSNAGSGLSAIRCTAGQNWRGLFLTQGGSPLSVLVTDLACTQGDGTTSLGTTANPCAMHLVRTV